MFKIIATVVIVIWAIISLCMYFVIFSFAAGSGQPWTPAGFIQIILGVPFLLVPVLVFNLIRFYLNPPK
jgi:Na+-driven multidrug efflux pump